MRPSASSPCWSAPARALKGCGQEYEAWKRANDGVGWVSKYYKGLGTSSSAEAREYFSELEQHELTFLFNQGDEELVDMAFNKDKAGCRPLMDLFMVKKVGERSLD